MENGKLPLGFPTHSIDLTGKIICLGDVVDYDFEGDDPCPFEVIFEDNAFRKKYINSEWDEVVEKPLLPYGNEAIRMKLKIVKKYNG